MYEYAARVTKVHDGDTFGVKIDLGFHVWLSSDVRLEGINSPELTVMVGGKRKVAPDGEAATIALMNMLGRGNFTDQRARANFGVPGDYFALPGKEPEVVIRTRIDGGTSDTEKYGRVLAQVRLAEISQMTLNTMMIQGGFAAPYLL